MTDLLALLCVVYSCVFVTFPYGVPGQVWYLIVSIPDLCLLPFFDVDGIISYIGTYQSLFGSSPLAVAAVSTLPT